MSRFMRSIWFPILTPPLIVLLMRILFQGFLFPTELSGDEAQYWDWSRHLQLSYYTKGPLIAWMIAFSTTLLGDSELAIRLGSYLAHTVAGISVGYLGFQLGSGSRRVIWLSAIGFQCLLAYQIAGSLMTVDMTMVAGWSIATVSAITAVQRSQQGRSVRTPLALCGLAFGFSFLAKYTALLGLSGILFGLWPHRQQLRQSPGIKSGLLLGLLLLFIGMAPVVLWNAARGWPTISHLLGHLEIPRGDGDLRTWTEFNIRWPLTYLLQIFSIPGPLLATTMLLGIYSSRKESHTLLRISLWSALPVLFFYLLVSFKGETEGNWAVGALAMLTPFSALWIDRRLSHGKGFWITRLILVRATLTFLLILTLPSSAPLVQASFDKLGISVSIPLHRVAGHRQFADQVRKRSIDSLGSAGQTTPIICNYYDLTALLAYSLPDHPIVYCASVALGSRPSAYDDFEETLFPRSNLLGIDLILVGSDEQRWRESLDFTELESLGSAIQRGRSRAIFRAKLRSLPIDKEH
ncbi:MAG: glycosyltransferase family 39 protein [Planctomycetota bacterium]